MSYFTSVFVAIDQLLNALLGGACDESLSSRAYRADRDGKLFGKLFRPFIDTAFFWQDRHCYQAYLAEVHRRQLSQNFR